MDRGHLLQIKNALKYKAKAIGVLAAARRGSLPELLVLSDYWLKTDTIQPVEAFDAFLSHLGHDQVPIGRGSAEAAFVFSSTPASRAYHSLMGIAGADSQIASNYVLTSRILEAWPGIHAWSLYFFESCVEALDKSDRRREVALCVLSAAWYSISTHKPVRPAMVNTPQTLEIATHLWMEEEDVKRIARTNTPYGTCLMFSLLDDVSFDSLERVLQAAGEKPLVVADLAIGNARHTLMTPPLDGNHFAIHLGLISSLSRFPNHPFRHAFLSRNVISFVTSALVKLGQTGHSNNINDLMLVGAMLSCFEYLYNYLESTDGFTWVSQAIRAGLLQAFCDCSPKFDMIMMFRGHLDTVIFEIFKTILPRYMVYQSVLELIENSLKRVDRDPHRKRVMNSLAKQTWGDFRALAEERIAMTYRAQNDHSLVCDNVKCRRVGTKEDMRACAACMNTYYCSKECQVASWKEGDHKTMCKMQQQCRLEGKSAATPKKDTKFLNALTIQGIVNHLPHLRDLAQRNHPGLAYHDLAIKVDYTVNPPIYDVAPLTAYRRNEKTGILSVDARNDALIENVQQNPEKYVLFDSVVAYGTETQRMVAIATGSLWEADPGSLDAGFAEEVAQAEDF